MKNLILFTLFSFVFVLTNAQSWMEAQKIVASDRDYEVDFGLSVSINNDYAIVGSQRESNDSFGGNYVFLAGAAYFYKKDGTGHWNETQKIVGSDRGEEDLFGHSVVINGNYAIIGAPQHNEIISGNTITLAGTAYIFKKDQDGNWNEIQKIGASDKDNGDLFGSCVAMSNSSIFVGAYSADLVDEDGNTVQDAGAVYVFEQDQSGNWTEIQKISVFDKSSEDFFGYALSTHNNYVIVGSLLDDEDALNSNFLDAAGSAYIFEKDGNGDWMEVQKIVASDRADGDKFGQSVSIHNDCVAVGSPAGDSDINGGNILGSAGSVYIFEKDQNGKWNEVQKIVASDRGELDKFGLSIDNSDEYIIVGAYLEDEDTQGGNTTDDTGSAYIFKKDASDNWSEVQKIIASDREFEDRFGYSLSISGDNIIVGAYQEDHDSNGGDTKSQSGSAYIFSLSSTSKIDNDVQNSLSAYPVPTDNRLTIELGQTYNTIDVIVRNVLGQIILMKNFTETALIQFDVIGSSGMYWAEIKTSDRKSMVLKILKN